jgi:hypothetical protein
MDREFVDRLIAVEQKIPERLEIPALRAPTIAEGEGRLRRLLEVVGESAGEKTGRTEWRREEGRTIVRMASGGRAAAYHASGAMQLSTGLAPMEHLYPAIPERDALEKDVRAFGDRIGLGSWVGKGEELRFERLWQIKAQGASAVGNPTEPVLCRAVGAHRHVVRGFPVWGAASATIALAGDLLDRVTVQVRETTGEVLTDAPILPLDRVATTVAARVRVLLGGSNVDLDDIAEPAPLQFGYVSLGRRKPQRLLAPAFVASVKIGGAYPHGLAFVIAATEEPFIAFEPAALEAPPIFARRKPNPGAARA